MIPYLITFILSEVLLIGWAKTRKNNKKLSIILVAIALCIPCLLASLRSMTVGVDTYAYKELYFDSAINHSSFFSYLETQNTSSEVLFHLVVWLSARFMNVESMFFILQLLSIIPVFLALNLSKDKKVVIIGMLFFYLFAYNESFNMIRQSISLSFSILSIALLYMKKSKIAVCNTIVAILFHNSAVIMVPIMAFVAIMRRVNQKWGSFLGFVSAACIMLGVFLMQEIIALLNSLLSIKAIDKYAGYSERFSSVSFNYPVFVIWVLLVILAILFIKKMNDKAEYKAYLYFGIIYIFSFFANVIIHYSNRAFFYLGYPFVITFLPNLIVEQKNKGEGKFLLIIIAFTLGIYWLLSNVIWNYNQTIPYVMGA